MHEIGGNLKNSEMQVFISFSNASTKGGYNTRNSGKNRLLLQTDLRSEILNEIYTICNLVLSRKFIFGPRSYLVRKWTFEAKLVNG